MADKINRVIGASEVHGWMRCPKRQRLAARFSTRAPAAADVIRRYVASRGTEEIPRRVRYDEETGDAAALHRAKFAARAQFEQWCAGIDLRAEAVSLPMAATISLGDWRVSIRGAVELRTRDSHGVPGILEMSAAAKPPDHLLSTLSVKAWLMAVRADAGRLDWTPPALGHALWLPRRAGPEPMHKVAPFEQLVAYGEKLARSAALDSRQDTPRPNVMCRGCYVSDCLMRR